MEIEDLERELNETPQEVNEAAVTEALRQAEEPQTEEPAKPEADEAEENTVNLMQFGQIITNIYCGLSDYVYKRVKKTSSAPEWEQDTKEAIEQSLTAFLAQYNVQMTPTTQLIVVLASVEAVRYTVQRPKTIQSRTENNEPADK